MRIIGLPKRFFTGDRISQAAAEDRESCAELSFFHGANRSDAAASPPSRDHGEQELAAPTGSRRYELEDRLSGNVRELGWWKSEEVQGHRRLRSWTFRAALRYFGDEGGTFE